MLELDNSVTPEANMKLLLDSVPLCCTLWDNNLKLFDCNLEALNLFEISSKQKFLTSFFQLSPKLQPDGTLSKDKAVVMLQETLERGRAVYEWMHQKLDKEPLPTQKTLARMDFVGGRSLIAVYTRDLRETRAAEAKIMAADERVGLMLDNMPLGCTFWDKNVNLIDCNIATLKMFGTSDKSEFIKHFFDFSPEYQPDERSSRKLVQELIGYAFKHGGVSFEWVHKGNNGEMIPVEVTLNKIKSQTGNLVIGYIRDLREVKDKIARLKAVEKLAFSDSLTNIYNRRYFLDYAANEFRLQKSGLSHVGIIMFDIDHFKDVNDTYGHDAGDEALKHVSLSAQSVLRETDLFARYGGEEFIVLVQHMDLYSLAKLGERICKKIEQMQFSYANIKIPITVSAGIALRNNVGHTVEEVIRCADIALYQAKRNGRNRVEVFAD